MKKEEEKIKTKTEQDFVSSEGWDVVSHPKIVAHCSKCAKEFVSTDGSIAPRPFQELDRVKIIKDSRYWAENDNPSNPKNVAGTILKTMYGSSFNVKWDNNKTNHYEIRDVEFSEGVIRGLKYQDRKLFCDSCYDTVYFTCSFCSRIRLNDGSQIREQLKMCGLCYENRYVNCHSCKKESSRSRAREDEDGYLVCTACYVPPVIAIHDYSYKPEAEFHRGKDETKSNSFCVGIELEVEKKHGTEKPKAIAKLTTEKMGGLIYCKDDGSLNNGFEIVSHPMTELYLKEKGKKQYTETLLFLKEKGYVSYDTDTCGMHVHIEKSSFSTWHLYRFMKFFHDNKVFILFLSQRKEDNFNQWSRLSDESKTRLVAKAKRKLNGSGYERYQAINLTRMTAEVRIFRGTICAESFFKNLEFIFSLHRFTKDNNADKINVANYIDFVKNNKSEYANLFKWLKKKKDFMLSKYSLTL